MLLSEWNITTLTKRPDHIDEKLWAELTYHRARVDAGKEIVTPRIPAAWLPCRKCGSHLHRRCGRDDD